MASVHNPAFPISRSLLAGKDLTGIRQTLTNDVWLLEVLFCFLKARLHRPLLVGGDFNDSRLLDEPIPRGNAECFDRIAAEGFTSLHQGEPSAPACSSRAWWRPMTRIEGLQELTREGYRNLQRRFPSQFILGGCLLLGKQYAPCAPQAVVFGVMPECQPATGHERTG